MNLELISVKDRLEQGAVKSFEPIVGGLLFRKSMAVLGAPQDSFKTNWALQLAVSLAAGAPCFSYSCNKSVVVCLILEGGEDYILERVEEKVAAMKLDRSDVMSRIYVEDCSQMQLDNRDDAADIEVTLLSMNPKPDLVIFDPITYALNEDVRFSPHKSKLCRNLIDIARGIDGVMLPIVHCRKGSQDNDDMDDFLGTSIIAAAAATRIKLYRDEDKLNMYVETRYAPRPEMTSLVWKYPLLEVIPTVLAPREECKKAVINYLCAQDDRQATLSELQNKVAKDTGHNPKTVRIAIDNLGVEGKLIIERLSKRATKMVRLVEQQTIHAS